LLVKNPKLIPQTLIDLASYYGLKSLEVYYKRPKWAKTNGFSEMRGCAWPEEKRIVLFLRSIQFNSDLTHYGYWRGLLNTFLHEVGHIRNPDHIPESRTTEFWAKEDKVNRWRNREIARLLSLDDGLFEPGYLGIYDIVRRHRDYDEIRARYVGSQYPLKDVILEIFDGQVWGKRYTEASRLIKRLAIRNNTGKVHEDRRGRKHFFLNYGEVERLKEAKIISAIRNFGIPEGWYRSIEYVARRHEQLMIKERCCLQ